jgi:hypothetical protein
MSKPKDPQRDLRDEIQRQLVLLKRQLDKELAEDLKKLRTELRAEILAELRGAARDAAVDAARDAARDAVRAEIPKAKSELESTLNNQLATRSETAGRELVATACRQMGNVVYKKVIEEVNHTLVPKIDNMATWLNYQTQDTAELVNDYRRAVYKQNCEGQLALTDGGKPNKPYIQPGVDVFFGENDY